MSLLEYILIFIVIVLVLWLVSALVGRGADIEMIENLRDNRSNDAGIINNYSDMCDKYELKISRLQAENKQLKHDLEQYKDACEEHANQACVYREKIADLQETIRDVRKALDE